MTRISVVPFFFFFLLSIAKGQPTQLNDMINDCLLSCMEKSEIQLIAIDYYPFNFKFSDSLKEQKPHYVSLNCFIWNYNKRLRKGEYVLLFDGLLLYKSRLTITFSRRFVTQKGKKEIEISISDSYKFVFEYSHSKERWILIEDISGGI